MAITLHCFNGAEINVPEDLVMFENGRLSPFDGHSSDCRLIIYLDPEECHSCFMDHLPLYDPLFHLQEEYPDYEAMVIFSPDDNGKEELEMQLRYLDFHHPVYYDGRGSFRKQNASIPKDPRFHTFLVSNGRVIFVGFPMQSEALWKLFRKKLSVHVK